MGVKLKILNPLVTMRLPIKEKGQNKKVGRRIVIMYNLTNNFNT